MPERDLSPAQLRTPSGTPLARRSANPVAKLQGAIGNRAVGQVLARKTSAATVQIGKLGPIAITGGNAGEWASGKVPDTLEVTSKKGRHSGELERMSKARTRVDLVKVTAPIGNAEGQQLDLGSMVMDFKNPRIIGYAVDGDVETWRAVDFDAVNRTKTTRKVS